MDRPRVNSTRPRVNGDRPRVVKTAAVGKGNLSPAAERLIQEQAPSATPHVPTPKLRSMVCEMCAFGITHMQIAQIMGISQVTLEKHYPEMKGVKVEKNLSVAKNLFKLATGDTRQAAISAMFWLKSQAGWRDQPQKIELTGADGGPIQSEQVGEQRILTHEERAIRILQILNAATDSGPGLPDSERPKALAPATRAAD